MDVTSECLEVSAPSLAAKHQKFRRSAVILFDALHQELTVGAITAYGTMRLLLSCAVHSVFSALCYYTERSIIGCALIRHVLEAVLFWLFEVECKVSAVHDCTAGFKRRESATSDVA